MHRKEVVSTALGGGSVESLEGLAFARSDMTFAGVRSSFQRMATLYSRILVFFFFRASLVCWLKLGQVLGGKVAPPKTELSFLLAGPLETFFFVCFVASGVAGDLHVACCSFVFLVFVWVLVTGLWQDWPGLLAEVACLLAFGL